LESDAWTTGHLLVALHEVGGVAPTDPAYQLGVEFLLRTQFPDGSWWVKSRTWPFQPHFDSQFPHGKDQWISAGGTAWAVWALLNTLPEGPAPTTVPTAQVLMATHATSNPRPTQPIPLERRAHSRTFDSEFTTKVLPILKTSCADCHGGENAKGRLRVESLASLLQGGQSGEPAVIPGKPDASPLLRYVTDQVEDVEMPPLRVRARIPALTQDHVRSLRDWIAAGVP
jgi:hypothetical protein